MEERKQRQNMNGEKKRSLFGSYHNERSPQ